ncbi:MULTISPECIES: hypothetical protein [unclassified Pseudomonas]|uniref:hypothetical protein n=1 Tax=unclassified Pseudomonas TaxID=196821 RepID=UPI000A1D8DF1|nr:MULTISPECIES: hypothetical protein [unclassified Pseudomonas]
MSQHDDPVPAAKPNEAAWLGQAGLYRTRFDAVCNFEQSVTAVSVDELFELASKQVVSQLIDRSKLPNLRGQHE